MEPNPADAERRVRRGANGELEVFPARRRLGLGALLSLALTMLSVWVLIWARPTTFFRSQAFIKVVGASGVALFGLFTMLLFVRALSRRPLVVVSDDGILDNESMFQLPLVNWSEIAGVDIEEEQGEWHLRVRLHDPEAVVRRCRSPISRAAYSLGLRYDRPVVSVSQVQAGIPLEELKTEIEARLRSSR